MLNGISFFQVQLTAMVHKIKQAYNEEPRRNYIANLRKHEPLHYTKLFSPELVALYS